MSLLHHRTTPAIATILETDDSMWVMATGSRYGGKPMSVKVSLRVKPEGQPEFNSETRVHGQGGFGLNGHDTYVLYDPAHPEHCDIDTDRLASEYGANAKVVIPHLRTHDVVQLTDPEAAAPAVAAQTDMVDGLERLATLHGNGTLSDDEFAAAKARLLDGDPAT
jgi:hypothetical protein